jgi:hypothetical protein
MKTFRQANAELRRPAEGAGIRARPASPFPGPANQWLAPRGAPPNAETPNRPDMDRRPREPEGRCNMLPGSREQMASVYRDPMASVGRSRGLVSRTGLAGEPRTNDQEGLTASGDQASDLDFLVAGGI